MSEEEDLFPNPYDRPVVSAASAAQTNTTDTSAVTDSTRSVAPPTVSAPAPSDHATEATEDEELSRALRDSLAFEQEDIRRRQEEDEALLEAVLRASKADHARQLRELEEHQKREREIIEESRHEAYRDQRRREAELQRHALLEMEIMEQSRREHEQRLHAHSTTSPVHTVTAEHDPEMENLLWLRNHPPSTSTSTSLSARSSLAGPPDTASNPSSVAEYHAMAGSIPHESPPKYEDEFPNPFDSQTSTAAMGSADPLSSATNPISPTGHVLDSAVPSPRPLSSPVPPSSAALTDEDAPPPVSRGPTHTLSRYEQLFGRHEDDWDDASFRSDSPESPAPSSGWGSEVESSEAEAREVPGERPTTDFMSSTRAESMPESEWAQHASGIDLTSSTAPLRLGNVPQPTTMRSDIPLTSQPSGPMPHADAAHAETPRARSPHVVTPHAETPPLEAVRSGEQHPGPSPLRTPPATQSQFQPPLGGPSPLSRPPSYTPLAGTSANTPPITTPPLNTPPPNPLPLRTPPGEATQSPKLPRASPRHSPHTTKDTNLPKTPYPPEYAEGQPALRGVQFGTAMHPFSLELSTPRGVALYPSPDLSTECVLPQAAEHMLYFPDTIELGPPNRPYFVIRAYSWKLLLQAMAWYGKTVVRAQNGRLFLHVAICVPWRTDKPSFTSPAFVCLALSTDNTCATKNPTMESFCKSRQSSLTCVSLVSHPLLLPTDLVTLAQSLFSAPQLSSAPALRELKQAIASQDEWLESRAQYFSSRSASNAASSPAPVDHLTMFEQQCLQHRLSLLHHPILSTGELDAQVQMPQHREHFRERVRRTFSRWNMSNVAPEEDLAAWITPYDVSAPP